MRSAGRARDGQQASDVSQAQTAAARAHPEDAALVERLLAGDEAAIGGLVEQYHGRLVFVSDRAAAEEVVQDTWVAVLTDLQSFEGRSGLTTWIFSILTNRAKTRGQRDKRSVPFSALGGQPSQDEPAVAASRFSPSGRWTMPPEQWDDDTPERLLLRHEIRGLIPNVAFLVIGVAELALILAFVAGYQKALTYGLVLVLHAVSTFSSYRQYLAPFDNLLFFAAWPMLAACFALYWLRDLDTRWTVGGARA